MARADDYRRYAAECLALAQRAKTADDRARLVEMAQAWNEMALKAGEAPHSQSQNKSPGDDSGR
jgi:hypothetical protein